MGEVLDRWVMDPAFGFVSLQSEVLVRGLAAVHSPNSS